MSKRPKVSTSGPNNKSNTIKNELEAKQKPMVMVAVVKKTTEPSAKPKIQPKKEKVLEKKPKPTKKTEQYSDTEDSLDDFIQSGSEVSPIISKISRVTSISKKIK